MGSPVAEGWDVFPPLVLVLIEEVGLLVEVTEEAVEAPEPGLALVLVVGGAVGLAIEALFAEFVGPASPTTTPLATISATVYVHCSVPE